MKKTNPSPPKFFLRFFRWFCHPEMKNYIEGDLMELYDDRLKELGKRKAYRRFIMDVLWLIRPGIVRPIDELNQLNDYNMFRNYIKIGIRNILKYQVFSFINITGLGVGMACCILITLYVEDELSYDRYHKNLNGIYRVLHVHNHSETIVDVWGNAPVGPALLADFPEIQSVFQFTSPPTLLFEYGDKRFQENNMVFADSTAFEIFSWKLVAGDSKNALKSPNSIVLTQTSARKYFGEDDPIGELLNVDQEVTFLVTGVMEDVPSNSHFSFDGLISMTTYRDWQQEIFDNWGYVDFYTYFLIDDHAAIEALEGKIPDFINRHLPDWDYTIAFEPLTDAYLHSEAGRQPGITGSLSNVYIFSSIAIFVLLIACINFINLSTARSIERAKEVGIRKVSGAQQYSLIYQFLSESILVSLLAGLLAIVLIVVVLPMVQELSGKSLPYNLLLSWRLTPLIMGGVVLIGVLAGSYPAWILARYRPAQVLKGVIKSTSGRFNVRKGLVVFQFSLSMILIVGTTVVFSQMKYLRTHGLGFNQEQMLIVDFGWDNRVQQHIESIKAVYHNHPSVHSVAASRAVPGNFLPNAYTGIESQKEEMIFNAPAIYEIDADFISNYEIEIRAGRAFSKDFPADSTQSLLLNEAAVRLYGYVNPEEIIGKNFSQWGRKGTVIGVVKDFNYKSLHIKVEPLTLRMADERGFRNLSMRVKSDNLLATIAELERLWEQLVPQRPFLYSFLDDTFDSQYQADIRFGRIFGVFAGLAIFIACLGLFGLTTYSTGQRRKEIGIRKVLGASLTSIVALLSKDFIKLFLLAMLIAVPVSWYAMDHWLDNFAYKVGIGIEIFVVAGLVSIVTALATVSWQSIKAALGNPVNALKNE